MASPLLVWIMMLLVATSGSSSSSHAFTTPPLLRHDGNLRQQLQQQRRHHCPYRRPPPTVALHGTFSQDQSRLPSCIESPVLKQVYPSLVKHLQDYGNPNIPLGTPEGRQCETLRRMQTQQKLSNAEVSLLEEMHFRFDSLEDVYEKVDFNEMLRRLLTYKTEYEQGGYQVPKKFAQDPELGAWVTGLRRLGPTGVDPAHAKVMEEIGFVWKSNRKCGSAFMKQWREIRDRVQTEGDGVLKDEDIRKWTQAQRDAQSRGGLGETRCHYMAQLFGEDWLESRDED